MRAVSISLILSDCRAFIFEIEAGLIMSAAVPSNGRENLDNPYVARHETCHSDRAAPPCSCRMRRGAWGNPGLRFVTRSQRGLRVHSSVPSAFRAPMLRSNRSVVGRSAAIPFSSCPTDLNPLADHGSFSIARSLRLWFHSLIAFQTIRILPRWRSRSYTK